MAQDKRVVVYVKKGSQSHIKKDGGSGELSDICAEGVQVSGVYKGGRLRWRFWHKNQGTPANGFFINCLFGVGHSNLL